MNRILAAAVALAASSAFAGPLQIYTENNRPFNFEEGGAVKGTATETVQALLKKAGLEAKITVMDWDDAYAKVQATKDACLYSTARVEARERLFKWYGPIAQNTWALYGASAFDSSKVKTARDARFFKIGSVSK